MNVAFFGYDFFFDCLSECDGGANKVVFIGTYGACDNKRYNFNTRTRQFAGERKIELIDRRPNAEDVRALEAKGCDLLVVAAYPHRIPIEVASGLAAINVHPSLLPVGRGPWPLPWVILKEMSETGVTIHKVSQEFDAGDVISRQSFEIRNDETLESLSCKTQMAARNLVRDFLSDPTAALAGAKSQHLFGTPAYWGMPTAAERTLDWSLGIAEISKRARAFGKFDSLARFDNQDWIVQDVNVWHEHHTWPVGAVVHRSSLEVVIAASDGFVCLRQFELDP